MRALKRRTAAIALLLTAASAVPAEAAPRTLSFAGCLQDRDRGAPQVQAGRGPGAPG